MDDAKLKVDVELASATAFEVQRLESDSKRGSNCPSLLVVTPEDQIAALHDAFPCIIGVQLR